MKEKAKWLVAKTLKIQDIFQLADPVSTTKMRHLNNLVTKTADATEHQLPHWIAVFTWKPNTGKRVPPNPSRTDWCLVYLPQRDESPS